MKGIGDWTADIYLMFCLHEKDIFPTGDIAVINTIKESEYSSDQRRNNFPGRKMETPAFSLLQLIFYGIIILENEIEGHRKNNLRQQNIMIYLTHDETLANSKYDSGLRY